MPDLALPGPTRRRRWARPGSPHDHIVAWARALLPIGIGVLAGFLVMAPLTRSGDVSFVLDKNKVEVARERLRIQQATYRGEDGKGAPFALTANSAVQRSSTERVVKISGLSGEMRLPDGPATLKGNDARYDMATQRVMIDGPIAFRAADGYTLDTHDATIDMAARTLASGGAVSGRVPQGTFSADRLHANLETNTVTLDGRARLRIVPRRAR